jgi:hypothetical protein
MPFTTPTVADFRVKFPELADRPDPVIIPQLAEASLWVVPDPEFWEEADYFHALLLLAAHYLLLSEASEGNPNDPGGGGGTASAVQTFVQRVTIGDRSVSYGKVDTTGSSGGGGGGASIAEEFLLRTIYGERYLLLRNRNIVPVAIV